MIGKFSLLTTALSTTKKVIESVLKSYGKFETLQTKLEIVTGSATKAANVFKEFKDFARISPFDLGDITNAGTQLIQVGMDLQEVYSTLKMIGDASGGNRDIFQRMITNYVQIMAAGKSTAMDIRQFAYMGLPIYKVLKDMGVQGTATASDVKKAFQIMTGEGGAFFNGMEKHAKTFEGTINKLKLAIESMRATFGNGSGIGEGFKNTFAELTRLINNFTNALENPAIQKFFEFMFKGIGTEIIGKALTSFNDWVDKETLIAKGKQAELEVYSNKNLTPYEKKDKIKEAILGYKMSRSDEEMLAQVRIDNLANKAEFYKTNRIAWDRAYNQAIRGKIKEFAYTNELGELSLLKGEKKDALASKIKRLINEYSGAQAELENAVKEKDEKFGQEINNRLNKIRNLESLLWETEESIKIIEAKKEYDRNLGTAKDEIQKLYSKTSKGKADETMELVDKLRGYKTTYAKDLTDEDKAMIDVIIEELLAKGKKAMDKASKNIENFFDKVARLFREAGEYFAGGDFSKDLEKINYLSKQIGEKKEEIDKATSEEERNEKKQDLQGLTEALNLTKDNINKNIGYTMAYAGLSTLQGAAPSGSDASNFIQNYTQTNNLFMAIIMTVIQAFIKVFNTIDGFTEIFDGVTELITRLKPALEPIVEWLVEMTEDAYSSFALFDILGEVLRPFIQLISKFTQIMSLPMKVIGLFFEKVKEWGSGFFDLLDDFSEWIDKIFAWLDYGDYELKSEQEEELERLKELNAQYKNLTQMIKEQEEYYLKKRQEINSDTYKDKILNVNDMILTPQGTFSTHPDDYLIATKNPYALGGNSKVVMNVNISNNASDVVEANAVERDNGNGIKELFVTISKKIAQDVAKGDNGWDSALMNRDLRIKGRRIVS